MFIELNDALSAAWPPGPSGAVHTPIHEAHPLQLTGWIEAVWEVSRRFTVNSNAPFALPALPALGSLRSLMPLWHARVDLAGGAVDFEAVVLAELQRAVGRQTIPPPWRHLMYAYLLENTRVLEVFQRVLHEAVHDETLGPFSEDSLRWLRITEDLFFRPGSSSFVASLSSTIRPDFEATRRNAYHRLFGIDLNHGAPTGGPYPYTRATVSNGDFIRIFQDLLRELWRGHINSSNTSGPRTTDEANIRELLTRLRTMLRARRQTVGGRANLAREEFVAVAMLSWFDLALATNTPIVVDLKAAGDSPEDRLRKIAERVKVASHGKSRSFFQLARTLDANGHVPPNSVGALPEFLREIEETDWESAAGIAAIPGLYVAPQAAPPAPPPAMPPRVARTLMIANHWSLATGVDLKAAPVTASSP